MNNIEIYYKNTPSKNNRMISFFIHDNLETLLGAGFCFEGIEASGKQQRSLKKEGANGLPCVKINDELTTDIEAVIEYLKYTVNQKNKASLPKKPTEKASLKKSEDYKNYAKALLNQNDDDDGDEDSMGSGKGMGKSATKKMEEMARRTSDRQRNASKKEKESGGQPTFKITGGGQPNKLSVSKHVSGNDAFDDALRKKMDGSTKSFKGKANITNKDYM